MESTTSSVLTSSGFGKPHGIGGTCHSQGQEEDDAQSGRVACYHGSWYD